MLDISLAKSSEYLNSGLNSWSVSIKFSALLSCPLSLAATAFPKRLGMIEEKEVMVKNGRFGYYLTHNGKNFTIPTDKYDEHLSIEDATDIILAASNASAAPKKGVIKVFDNMEVREGPYGPYILYNKAFYESCDALLAISKQTKLINELVLGDKAKSKRFCPQFRSIPSRNKKYF